MIEARGHHARRRADGDECRCKLCDARLEREHLAIGSRQSPAQEAVVGIEFGGAFRHEHRSASNVGALAFSIAPRLLVWGLYTSPG